MDGSILPIAFGAFTVLYIAGWFCIGRFLAVRARFGRGTARRPLEPIRLSRASVRSMILTHHFINGPGAYILSATTLSPAAAGSARNRANHPSAGDTRRPIPRW